MPQAKPAYLEKAKQLGELIETIIQQPNKPSDELLNKTEALAQPLIFPEETSYYAYQSLGVIAAVRGNAQKTKQYFKCAFNKAPQLTSLYAAYAQTLKYLGKWKEALAQINFYISHKTGDLFSLDMAFRLCIISGQITKGRKIMLQIDKLTKGNIAVYNTDLLYAEIWEKTGIPEDIRLAYVEKAYQYAVENGINTRHPILELDIEDGQTLYYTFRDNDHSIEELQRLDTGLMMYLIPFIKAHKGVPLMNVVFSVGRFDDHS